MEIRTTSHFDKNLAKKIKKNSRLKNKIKNQISILQNNLHHPSLKLHKLKGKRIDEYSFWIEDNLRITCLFVDDVILFTDIITHDEY